MNHLEKAFVRADSFVSAARHKAAQPGALPPSLSGDSLFSGKTPTIAASHECYAHNREWVYACVRLISTRIAGQAVRVARKGRAKQISSFATKALGLPRNFKSHPGTLEPLESHELIDVLADPYEMGTAWSLMYVTAASLELTGRAFWLMEEDENGKKGLYPIPSSWVKIDWDSPIWKIKAPGCEEVDVESDHLVHFYYPDPADPRNALSPLVALQRSVFADESITTAQTQSFARGIYPSAIVTIGDNPDGAGGTLTPVLTQAQRNQILNSIRSLYAGAHKHEPVILDGLVKKIEKWSLTPDEMGFLDSSAITKSRILQGFGIGAILLGDVDSTSYAAYNAADKIFCATKVNPLIALLSQTMTEWLPQWFGEDLAVWIEEAVPNNDEMTFKQYQYAHAKGAVSDDEYRAYMGMGPKPKDDESQTTQDVQAAALNGAQIDSLLNIVSLVTLGQLTNDAARGIIRAAFPLLPDAQIDGIVNELKRVDNASQGNEQGQQGNGSSNEPDSDDAATDDEEAKQVKAFVQALNPYTLRKYEQN